MTVVLYAAIARMNGTEIDTKTAFSTVAILTIVTHPANVIMTIVPAAIAAFANFDRIQSYLLEPSRVDSRESNGAKQDAAAQTFPSDEDDVAVHITEATVSLPAHESPVLRGINLKLLRGSVTTCSGPVGSGKSVLAKLILGDVTLSSGRIVLSSTKIGLCEQSAWLPNGTIQEIIAGFSGIVNEERYKNAVQTCCLEYDIDRLPNGHITHIGSRGINLSGGQRQRVVSVILFLASWL